MLVGRQRHFADDVRGVCGLRGFPGQRHFGQGQVADLTHGCRQVLYAGGLIDQPRGHAERNLIGVADAVVADVSVGAVQLDQIEIRQAGVENRQLVLIAVRHIAVHHARLQRLGELPPRTRIPLEYQTGVEPCVRHGAGGRARFAVRGVLQVVLRIVVSDRRLEKISGRAIRPADLGREIHAHARGADFAHEIGGLAVQQKLEFAVEDRPPGEGFHTRHTRIGPVARIDRGIDGLEVLQLSAHPPRIVVVQQVGAAFEEGDAGLIGAGPEVFEVAAVADAGDVGIQTQSRA